MTEETLMSSGLKWLASAVAAGCGVMTALAAATYTTTDGCLIVDVDAAGSTFDATQLGEGVTNIVKRGSGAISASPISSYTGDFRIEQGIWNFGAAGDFGATDSGTIDVMDGATINYTGLDVNTLKGKTVNLYGQPASGAKGKITRDGTRGTKNYGPGAVKLVRLVDSDGTFTGSGNRLSFDGTIDLNFHRLTLTGSNLQMPFTGVFTNGGSIVVKSGVTFMSENNSITFAADSAQTGFVEIQSGAVLNLKNTQNINGWSLVCDNGSSVQGNVNRKPTNTEYPQWDGPISFAGTVSMMGFEGWWGQSNTVYNIKGPVSGWGKLKIGPGWVNLHNAENTYTGAVVVTGKSADQTPTNSHNPIPPGGGGLGVWKGAAAFPYASSITLTNSAGFKLMDGVRAELPVLTFANSTDDQLFAGGVITGGQRSVSAGFVKTSAAKLTIDSPVAVTGKVVVTAGTLKVANRAKVGNRGLREHYVRSVANAYNNNISTWFSFWHDYEGQCEIVTNDVCQDGPHVVLNGSAKVPAKDADGKSTRNGYWYSGYVWNRSPTNETWQFLTDYSNPPLVMYVGAKHKRYAPVVDTQDLAAGKTNLPIQVEFSPGPTEIHFWIFGWAGGQIWPSLHNKKGLSYWRGPSISTNAFEAANTAHWAHFTQMKETGDGLFTSDTTAPEYVESTYDELPIFETLDMAAESTLDLSDNFAFRVGRLEGSPTIVNAPYFAVTNCWTLKAVETNAVLETDGELAFAEGATFAPDNARTYPRPGASGRVVARAAKGITGLPESANEQWKLTKSEDGKSLTLIYIPRGLQVILH